MTEDRSESVLAAWERENGPLDRLARLALLEGQRRREQHMGTSRHPIGAGAEDGADHHTRSNREAVAVCLREYFAGTLHRNRINKTVERSESETGVDLADRMVSHLDVANALDRLRRMDRYYWLLISRRFQADLTVEEISARWQKSDKTIARELRDGLHALIDILWIDLP